jgi:hypothetical protein
MIKNPDFSLGTYRTYVTIACGSANMLSRLLRSVPLSLPLVGEESGQGGR